MMRTAMIAALILTVLGAGVIALAAKPESGAAEHDPVSATAASQPAFAHPSPSSNRRLHDQVSLCNLVDALWLEDDQLRTMTAVLEQAMPEIERLADELERAGDDPAFGAAMAALRETLMRGQEPTEDLRRQVNAHSGPLHELRLSYSALQREVAAELLPLLTENQLVILGEYKPCLFNADDPLHPERIGQASGAGRMLGMLTRLRGVWPDVPEQRFDDGLRRLANHAYRDTPFAVDPEAEIERLRDVVERAMALSDEEFSLQAEALAAELMVYPEARDQMLADYYNVPTARRDRRLDKLAQMVVVPGAVEILRAETASRT
jgi:hypothetical protein